jgi:hypothetical protein
MFLTLLYPCVPVRSSATGTTECILIYYISTEEKSSPGKESCNLVPLNVYQYIEGMVMLVSMSNRKTTNKLHAITIGKG